MDSAQENVENRLFTCVFLSSDAQKRTSGSFLRILVHGEAVDWPDCDVAASDWPEHEAWSTEKVLVHGPDAGDTWASDSWAHVVQSMALRGLVHGPGRATCRPVSVRPTCARSTWDRWQVGQVGQVRGRRVGRWAPYPGATWLPACGRCHVAPRE